MALTTVDQDSGAIPKKQRPFLLSRRALTLWLLLILLVAAAAASVWLLTFTTGKNNGGADPSVITLTVVLVISAAIVLLMLMAISLLMHFVYRKEIDQTAPGPLGLPDGSVSAVLAVLLLIIFAITSVYLFSEINAGEKDTVESTGVTTAALQSLPQDRIVGITVESPGDATGAGRTYTVKMTNPHPASIDFAKTTSQTVGILLTAVAGFYFGNRAAQSGIKTAAQQLKTAGGGKGNSNSAANSAQGGAGAAAAGTAEIPTADTTTPDTTTPDTTTPDSATPDTTGPPTTDTPEYPAPDPTGDDPQSAS
jgi:hypothetical protein